MENSKVIVANYRYYITGGPEVYMFKFIANCNSIGFDAIPFSVKYSNNKETSYSKYFISNRGTDGVYYKDIKKTPKSIFRTLQGAFYNKEAAKKLNKLIDDENPKVLYALQVINTLSPSIFKVAKKRGLKVIHRISDFNLMCPKSDFLLNENVCEKCLKGNFKNGIINRCYHNSKIASMIRCYSMYYHRRKRLYDYIDYFVTPTNFTRNKLIAAGFNEKKIVVVPTFIDYTKIVPNYENYDYLLFLGRMVPEKGAKFAVEAMKYLLDFPLLKLKITGTLSDANQDIKDIIERNNLQDRIVFTGFVQGDELTDLISNSRAVLCPAIWYDNMPNTVLEAFSFGKTVIASNLGCFGELIDDGLTGYLFEPKNSKDLSSKIRNLMVDEKCRELGMNARKMVEKKYSPEQHFSKLRELFEKEY